MADAGGIRAGRAYVELGVKDSLSGALKAAEAKLRAWGSGITAISKRLAGAGAAILAPITGSLFKFAASGEELYRMSQRTGIAAEALSEFRFATAQTGTDLATFEVGVKKMEKAVFSAAQGSGEARDAFEQLGLPIKKLAALSPEKQLMVIAEQLAQIKDPGERAARALAIFGKSGTMLLPMLAGGAKGLEALRDEARRLGLVTSNESARTAAELTEAFNKMRASVAKAVGILGSTVAPTVIRLLGAVQPTVTAIKDWAAANRGWANGLFAAGAALVALGTAGLGLGLVVNGLANVVSWGVALGGAVVAPVRLAASAALALAATLKAVAVSAGAALAATVFSTARAFALLAANLVLFRVGAEVSFFLTLGRAVANLALTLTGTALAASLNLLWASFAGGRVAAAIGLQVASVLGGSVVASLQLLGASILGGRIAQALNLLWASFTGGRVVAALSGALAAAKTAIAGFWAFLATGQAASVGIKGVFSALGTVLSGAASVAPFIAAGALAYYAAKIIYTEGVVGRLTGYLKEQLAPALSSLKETALIAWEGIKAAFDAGEWGSIVRIAWQAAKVAWLEGVKFVEGLTIDAKQKTGDVLDRMAGGLRAFAADVGAGLLARTVGAKEATGLISADAASAARREIEQRRLKEHAEIVENVEGSVALRDRGAAKARDLAAKARQKEIDDAKALLKEEVDLVEFAKRYREMGPKLPEGLSRALPGVEEGTQQVRAKFESTGTFNALIAGQIGAQSLGERLYSEAIKQTQLAQEILNAGKKTEENTRDAGKFQ
jgi:hypothetical protein